MLRQSASAMTTPTPRPERNPRHTADTDHSTGNSSPGVFQNGSYHWQHDEEITAILNGDTGHQPETVEASRALVAERFGCVLHALPQTMQHDHENLMTATVLSGGHELMRVRSEVQDLLTVKFAQEAVQRGAPGWLLQAYPDNVRDNKEVVIAYVERDGLALRYASQRLRSDPSIIQKAIDQNPDSIIHAIRPPASLCDKANMLRTARLKGSDHMQA